MTKLKISPDLTFDPEFATEGVAVIGMRGSGKSNTEVRFAEVLFDAGIPWVAVDPKGDWWGMRSSADGKNPGLPVPIFGGLHQDFPLEGSTGPRIADLLVDQNLSAILDVSHLSKTGELPKFLTAFCNQLMHRHQLDPHVRTVILEEAHRYIPQSVTNEKAAVKEAAAAVLLEGRSFGLGCWAATQRPARLNKDVLEEVGNAIIHRIGVAATNDKKTIAGWVKHYDLSAEIVDSLTELADGQAWVLMPQDRIVKQVRMDRRRTFDSGGTPKVGAAQRRPSTLADVDQAGIKEMLSDVIERAKADDPKELHKRIRDLERQLAERPDVEPERVDVPVLAAEDLARLESVAGALTSALADVGAKLATIRPSDIPTKTFTGNVTPAQTAARTVGRTEHALKSVSRQVTTPRRGDTPVGRLPEGEQKILTAVAQQRDGADRNQLSLLTGYKRSTRDAYIQRLKNKELVAVSGSVIFVTVAGLDALGDEFEPLPTGGQLRDHWLRELPEGESKILAELIDAWPAGVSRDDLSDRTGYKRSTRDAYLQRLRTRKLITSDGEQRAADGLFE